MILTLILVIGMAGSALAAPPPTDVTVDWTGGGVVTGGVTTGDATTSFTANAYSSTGHFEARDFNDNPYTYGVDTFQTYMQSNFTGGGVLTYQTTRTDSYSPMYGPSGQVSYNYVYSSGTGAMASGSWTNYAQMTDALYGHPRTAGGHHLEASGDSFDIYRSIATALGVGVDRASIEAFGSGSAWLNSMTNEAFGSAVRLGWGGGCYTDAAFSGTGTQTVVADLWGGNNVNFIGAGLTVNGGGTPDSAHLQIVANYVNGTFNWNNYSGTAQ